MDTAAKRDKWMEALNKLHTELNSRYMSAREAWKAQEHAYSLGMADAYGIACMLIADILHELSCKETNNTKVELDQSDQQKN